jgi:hypothetical protein
LPVTFDVLVTVDKMLDRDLPADSTLAIITLVAPTNRIESLRPLIPSLLRALDSVRAGERIRLSS